MAALEKEENSSPDNIQSANWQGSIPVVLTLAASSVSSPTAPPPIHVLVARNNYLFLALEEAVRQFHQFAPTTLLSFGNGGGGVLRNEEPDPGTSFQQDDAAASEKESTDAAAAAATSEERQRRQDSNEEKAKLEPYPICWFEDEATQSPLQWQFFAGALYDLRTLNDDSSRLPWKIRLHFTAAYPSSQILPLSSGDDVVEQVRHYYKNSLKQALCVMQGNNKAALNLSKDSHVQLWKAIGEENFELFRQVDIKADNLQRIPVRLLIDNRPPLQRPCAVVQVQQDKSTNINNKNNTTLGNYLNLHLPDFFPRSGPPLGNRTQWKVAGLSQPPLEAPMFELWQDLRHPDHFLHIAVQTAAP